MLVNRFFAPCPRGLEAVLADELVTLGAADVEPVDGGVGFGGNLELMMRVNLHSRIASRVLWRIGGGRYRDERDIYRLARGIDWPLLLELLAPSALPSGIVSREIRGLLAGLEESQIPHHALLDARLMAEQYALRG